MNPLYIEQLLGLNILLSVCILVVVLLPYLLMLFSLILSLIVVVIGFFPVLFRWTRDRMKKVLFWMHRHWIITGLLVITGGGLVITGGGDEAYMNELSEKAPPQAPKMIKKKAAEEPAVYEHYKTELDAMNCGEIMAQFHKLQEGYSELYYWYDAGMTEYINLVREALDLGETDDAFWANMLTKKKTINANYKQEKAELEADYIHYRALERAAKKRGCIMR